MASKCKISFVILSIILSANYISCEEINNGQPSSVNEVGVGDSKPAASAAIPGNADQFRGVQNAPSGGFFYPVPHNVNWNRDTYADAASDFGYGQTAPQQHHHSGVSNQYYPPQHGVEYGSVDGYEGEGGLFGAGLGGLGGLGGIAGILGIKGLKGLGLLGLLKAGLPILAILIPALLLLPLLFLFFPVPVITVPSNQRSIMGDFGVGLGDITGKVSNLARSVLESDKCIERISCEMSRVSRGTFIDRTLKR